MSIRRARDTPSRSGPRKPGQSNGAFTTAGADGAVDAFVDKCREMTIVELRSLKSFRTHAIEIAVFLNALQSFDRDRLIDFILYRFVVLDWAFVLNFFHYED